MMTDTGGLQLIAVNVGQPRAVPWQGRTVVTGIFKEAVAGPVAVHQLNLAGDRQADLTVHGGADKAVYVYPAEHYGPWQQELGVEQLAWGSFGENLTVSGFREDQVWIGERWRIGSAEFVVRQPRQPCYKLGVRFGRADLVRRMAQNRRTGWYLAVEREGTITAGDPIVRLERPETTVSIAAVAGLLLDKKPDRSVLQIAATLPGLAADLRAYFQTLLV